MPGALAHELAHARVLPRRAPVERVLGREQRARARDARVGLEHVDVARTRPVSRLGERDRELALDRLGVHGEHVAGSDEQPVAHDRVGITGKRAGVHASHRSGAGIVRRVDLDLSDEHRLFRDTVRGFAEGVVAPGRRGARRARTLPARRAGARRRSSACSACRSPSRTAARAATRSPTRSASRSSRASTRRSRSRSPRTPRSGRCRSCSSATTRSARDWLPRLASGERLAAFGLTEPEAGSDAGATRTTARAEDGEWVIDGSKMFITNAGTEISGCVTITARTGADEISNFIVPNGTPGYDIGPPLKKMGWKSSDTRPLAFADCRIPSDNLLGPRGEGLHQFLDDPRRRAHLGRGAGARPRAGRLRARTRLRAHAPAVRARRSRASRRSSSSSPTWPPRSRRGAHSPTTPPGSRTAAGRSRTRPRWRSCTRPSWRAAWPTRPCRSTAATATWTSTPISRFYRDAKILEIGEGTNEIQRLVIARGLGLERDLRADRLARPGLRRLSRGLPGGRRGRRRRPAARRARGARAVQAPRRASSSA